MIESKVNISVIVPIKNEEKNLVRCLRSLLWADEIWVVDSNSSDSSVEIANGFGAKVVQFNFSGSWPKKKNWALESLPLRNEWVFIIDADEVLPAGFAVEVRAIIESRGEHNGYWINRRFMFMGQWLRHSYYPNWNLRLFKHSKGRYEKLTGADTQSGDNEVHEHVVVEGSCGYLRSEMDHFAFPDIGTFVEKHNRYSNWEARVALERSTARSAKGIQMSSVSWKRRLKAVSHRLPFRPSLRFIYVYFLQFGFLDGVAGYYFARMHAMYELMCVAKECELKRNSRVDL